MGEIKMKKFKKPALFALAMMPAVIIAALLSFSYQYSIMKETFETMAAQGPGLPMIFLAGMVQTLILLFAACFFGRILAEKLGTWKEFRFEKKPLVLTLIFSLMGGAILTLDCLTFGRTYPAVMEVWQQSQTLLGLLTGILYGGIVEELLMRLLIMSLLAFLLWKLFARKAETAPAWTLIIANLVASTLFAAGHLPATLGIFGELTPLLILRCFLLNGVGGLFFGYLYRKWGLQYSILCHMGFHTFFRLSFAIFF